MRYLFFHLLCFSNKVNTIKTLIYKAYNVCSSFVAFHQELKQQNNGFPLPLNEKCIYKNF